VAGIIWQSHVIWFHFIQETRVYNVEDDVAGIIWQSLPPGGAPRDWFAR